MTDRLQSRHGAALLAWTHANVLSGATLPPHIGAPLRLKLTARLTVMFALHTASTPITTRALADHGCGSSTQITDTLSLLIGLDILEKCYPPIITRYRTPTYTFTNSFIERVIAHHHGVGVLS